MCQLRFKFTLGVVLSVVLIIAVVFGCWIRPSELQRRSINALGGSVRVAYDHQQDVFAFTTETRKPSVPAWLWDRLGADYFVTVKSIQFQRPATDDDLRIVDNFARLQALHLDTHNQITDDGLRNLKGMSGLKVLNLNHSPITDRGLEHLTELIELRVLRLARTKVTDKGHAFIADRLPRCWIERPPYQVSQPSVRQ